MWRGKDTNRANVTAREIPGSIRRRRLKPHAFMASGYIDEEIAQTPRRGDLDARLHKSREVAPSVVMEGE